MQVKDKLIFRLAAFLGVAGLVLGTLGAHGLKFKTPELHKLFDTGVLYLFFHIPPLMILGILGCRKEALLMMAGVCCFSIPLVIKGSTEISGGIIVPIGGMLMIVAWIWVIIGGGEAKSEEETTSNDNSDTEESA